MSEQGITQDDERWITERDNEPGASFRTAMRAAIARGYERGRGESRDEIGNAVAILDEAGVECEDEIGERTLAGRVAALHRDRDRLAKRVADLEFWLAIADKAEAHARAQVDAYHDIGATTRLGDVESRLAATDARLTALVEALVPHWPSLAALRAPGVGANPTKDALREAVVDLMHAILGCDGHPCRIESDPLAYRDDALRRFRDIETSASQRHDAVAQVHGLESALATARRERDQAVEQSRITMTTLAARDAEIAGLKAKLAGAEHAIADLTTTFGTVESERDTLRARVAELEARDREGRWLLDAPGIVAPPIHEWADRRDAYLSAAPIPDPARGLIERCLDALDGRAMALRADLRAYLGGG